MPGARLGLACLFAITGREAAEHRAPLADVGTCPRTHDAAGAAQGMANGRSLSSGDLGAAYTSAMNEEKMVPQGLGSRIRRGKAPVRPMAATPSRAPHKPQVIERKINSTVEGRRRRLTSARPA